MTKYVFILGAGRSGTKILRDCIGCAEDVAYIPYDVGFVWKEGNQSIRHDELLPHHADEILKGKIRKSFNRIARKTYGAVQPRIILEKSVPNSLRPLFLKSIFPEAKFIHLVRDGRDVVTSSMRNWETPSDRGYMVDKLRYFSIRNFAYAIHYLNNKFTKSRALGGRKLWGPHFDGMAEMAKERSLLEVCTAQWLNCVLICNKQLNMMRSSDFHEVRFEDFVRDEACLVEILDYIGVEDLDSPVDFYRETVNISNVSNSQSSLSREDQAYILAEGAEALKLYGYV